MTGRADTPVDQALATVRRSRMVLIAIHLPMIAFLTLMGSTGLGVSSSGRPAIAVPAGLAIGALQLRHSLAFVRGERPRYAAGSFAVVVALSAVPIVELGLNWYTSLWFVGATGAMVLPRRMRVVALLGAPLLFTAINYVNDVSGSPVPLNAQTWIVAYTFTIAVMGTGCLYGAARLVCVIDELFEARAELAETAISHERLRVSRDLHDALGQSLSAVSLKGDLALRLLRPDPTRAELEVRSLTELARDALRDVRAVALDEHAVSLRSETTGAVALLEAAGIDAHIHTEVGELSAETDALLGWAVRECITNVLRHSAAAHCAIRATRDAGWIRLEIVNDGAIGTDGEGYGLAGLAVRAKARHGSSSAGRTADGWFRVHVNIPEEPG